MNDQDLFQKILNLGDRPLLFPTMAKLYELKTELKQAMISYVISSYEEPDMFSCTTPISELYKYWFNCYNFSNNLLLEIKKRNLENVLIKDLCKELVPSVSAKPSYDLTKFRMMKHLCHCHKLTLVNYPQYLFAFLRPRLFPDQINFLLLEKEKSMIYKSTGYLDAQNKIVSEIFLIFLRNKKTKEQFLTELTNLITVNLERIKESSPHKLLSDGEALNLLEVMLNLSAPFTSKYSRKLNRISDKNTNFISQCFWLTTKMIEIAWVVAHRHMEQLSYSFQDKSKEYILHHMQGNLYYKSLIDKMIEFIAMQLTFEKKNPKSLKMEVIFEVCNHLFRVGFIYEKITVDLIDYFVQAETDNPHFESLMARTISKINHSNPLVNQKLLKIYGGLKKVDLRERYICRMEIFAAVKKMNLSILDAKIVGEFIYGLFTEMNQFISDGIHYLASNAKNDNTDPEVIKAKETGVHNFKQTEAALELVLNIC